MRLLLGSQFFLFMFHVADKQVNTFTNIILISPYELRVTASEIRTKMRNRLTPFSVKPNIDREKNKR